ncbi:MAG: histidine--tRNA ligase [Clostridia bacterium]
MNISKPKGTKDIFFDEINVWQYVEENIIKVCKEFNIGEIRTPVFESTALFKRSVGDSTDIVNKEMYTFEDKGFRSITLRPELTAGVVRAYIENGMSSLPSPLKFWYRGNMYRYERMQKGRYREFSQFGVEIIGSDSNLADIESISVAYALFKRIGLSSHIVISLNSIGCTKCRNIFIQALKEYIKPNLNKMCDTCKVRFEKNPMRMIDCKEKGCKDILAKAPVITDYLCEDCRVDFQGVQNMLKALDIPFVLDNTIVRGLDYYNKTVYEITSKDLGLSVGGGGRYDGLVSILGGVQTPAVGFAIGMDRVVILLQQLGLDKQISKKVDLYFAIIDKDAEVISRKITSKLREMGYVVDIDIQRRSFKAQLKYADKIKARYVCIIGKNEIKNNTCIIKNMEDGKQLEVKLEIDEIINRLL